MEQNALLARLDRLESIEEIRQLAGKYSLSLDMRDLDAHVNLFAEDIRVGREKPDARTLKPGSMTPCATSSMAPRTTWVST